VNLDGVSLSIASITRIWLSLSNGRDPYLLIGVGVFKQSLTLFLLYLIII